MKKPPSRNGVGASTLVLPALNGLPLSERPDTLLSYLEGAMPLSDEETWLDRLEQGLLLNEHCEALGREHPYLPNQKIFYYRHVPSEVKIPVQENIVFEDAELLVADKPHFLPVTPKGKFLQETLLIRLKNRTGNDDLAPLHRLDRDTAGLVLLSKRSASRNAYAQLFRNQTIHKTYEAIAGPLRTALQVGQSIDYASHLETNPNSFMQMQENPHLAANSFTTITLIESHQHYCRYQLEPRTGKRHQLRVHLWALGAAIKGDHIYPVLSAEQTANQFDYANPLMLLAKQLTFKDPISGIERCFQSKLTLPSFAQ